MAVLAHTPDISSAAGSATSLALSGAVTRSEVDELRATLVAALAAAPRTVEVDLRAVTEFSRLGIAVLVAARRWFGDALRIRGNEAVVGLLDEAGLTRVVRPAA